MEFNPTKGVTRCKNSSLSPQNVIDACCRIFGKQELLWQCLMCLKISEHHQIRKMQLLIISILLYYLYFIIFFGRLFKICLQTRAKSSSPYHQIWAKGQLGANESTGEWLNLCWYQMLVWKKILISLKIGKVSKGPRSMMERSRDNSGI